MSFASPAWLAVAFAVPAALLVQWLVRRRARRYALRFPALTSVREAVGRTGGWRRHIPLVAMLLGVAVLAAALARPRVSSSMLLRSASLVLVSLWIVAAGAMRLVAALAGGRRAARAERGASADRRHSARVPAEQTGAARTREDSTRIAA